MLLKILCVPQALQYGAQLSFQSPRSSPQPSAVLPIPELILRLLSRGVRRLAKSANSLGFWHARLRLLALGLCMTAVWVPAISQITVSNGGQASTQHPIPMPPGIAGMVPSLSLEYDDGNSSGPLGFGWAIKGISSITRCPPSRAVDGYHAAVMMQPSDKLCLDGQRLIQTDSTGVPLASQVDDANGLLSNQVREFRTEKDSYVRIRAYGSAGGDSDLTQGPLYFRIWTKSGLVHHLGGGSSGPHSVPMPNSLVTASIQRDGQSQTRVATWAVSRITDVAGNYVNFVYLLRQLAWGSGPVNWSYMSSGQPTSTPGTEWNLAEVHYTGTSTQLPHNKIIFTYGERSIAESPAGHDRSESYFLNHKRVTVRRLVIVRSYINSPNHSTLGHASSAVPVHTLKLDYAQSARTGRSLLQSITQCQGASEGICMPPTRYGYRETAPVEFEGSAAFSGTLLRYLPMAGGSNPSVGVMAGDFNGDGRTDLLRWSANAAANELWLSTGGGGFSKATNFNITEASQVLNDASACHSSVVADFDGDGLTDILRATKAGCTSSGNVLFRSMGDGTFDVKPLPVNVNLTQSSPTAITETLSCGGIIPRQAPTGGILVAPSEVDDYGSRSAKEELQTRPAKSGSQPDIEVGEPCVYRYARFGGNRFYVLDANGDGVLDIVTTLLAPYDFQGSEPNIPTEQELCAGFGTPQFTGFCTRVFKGLGDGGFEEVVTPLDVKASSLFSEPGGNRQNPNPYWRLPDQADINGDGLQDILSTVSGRWRSRGNFDFTSASDSPATLLCGTPIDFNGDGRFDCLMPSDSLASQYLTLSFGASASPPVAQFSYTWGSELLFMRDSEGRQNVGLVIEDFDGDGRQDILRWGPTPGDNGIRMSRGDGSFAPRIGAGLSAVGPLQTADMTRTFLLGDFLGDGSVQILRMGLGEPPPGFVGPVPPTNELLVRKGVIGPPDLLAKVITPTGLAATLGTRVPITRTVADGGVYISDRSLAVVNPADVLDIQPPMYVIPSVTRETSLSPVTTLTSTMRYVGLKAERGGRGVLGFRQFHQTDPAPGDASQLTKVQEHLLKHPYNSLVRSVHTYLGSDATGLLISSSVNTYCDKTSDLDPNLATDSQPCPPQTVNPVLAKVSRSYLRRSVDTGNELGRLSPGGPLTVIAPLPVITTTNTFNEYGDGTKVVVTTQGQVAGQSVTHTRTTDNDVCPPDSGACPNKISGDNWILGRNVRTTTRSESVNLQAALRASPGNQPLAGAVQGNPSASVPPLLNPAVLAAILQLLLED